MLENSRNQKQLCANGIPIGFEMAEKKVYGQKDKHFDLYR